MRVDWGIRKARPVIRRKRRGAAYRYRGVVARNRWTVCYARRLAWLYSLPRWQREWLRFMQRCAAYEAEGAQRWRLREALRARGVCVPALPNSGTDYDRDTSWRDGLANDWNTAYHASHNHRY